MKTHPLKSQLKNKLPGITSSQPGEDIFSLLVENVKDYAIFIINPGGFIVSWNKGAENIKGYTAAEAIGKHISIFYTQKDIEANIPANNLKEALEKGRCENEGWRICKNGSRFWANIIFTPLYNEDGSLNGFAKITRDITARKKNEDKLTQLAALIENTSDAIFSTTLSLEILTWNKAAETLYGYTRDEVIGYTTLQTIRPQVAAAFLKERAEIIQTKLFWNGEITHIHKNGNAVIVSASISPTRDEMNNINGYIFIVRDKTEQKKAEEKIAHLATLIATTSDAIFSFDAADKILSWNAAAETMYCYTAEEAIGNSIIKIVRAVINENDREQLRREIAQKGYWTGEIYHTKKDGTLIPVNVSLTVKRNAGGDIEEYICICRDITGHKKAEEKARLLQQEIDKLNRLKLESSLKEISDYKYALDKSSIIAITDQRGIIQHVNDNFCAISGYTKEELIGKDHRIINSGYHDKAFIKNLWTTIAKGGVWTGELKNKAKNGTYYWVATTIVPFLDEKGKPYQYVAIRADITKRKKAEADLKMLNEELEERIVSRTRLLEIANKDLEAFSYSVSHDLRAPLRGISGFAKILQEDYSVVLDGEGLRLLDKIISNASTMGHLIDDLLNFTHLGKIDAVSNCINTTELVKACIAEIEANNQKLKPAITIEALPECAGDINMLRQVWLNLISNAIKYSAKKAAPHIIIGHQASEMMNTFYIKDNGAGFDMAYYNKLFGVFQRLHSVEEFEGTGVGLALVKLIIEKHKGKLWAQSAPGHGATFYFSLPKSRVI